MSHGLTKPSDKLRIITRSTFENYTQSVQFNGISTVKCKPIQNAKFKKTTKKYFHLLDFLTHRPKQKRRNRAAAKFKDISLSGRGFITKKRGKQREGGRKKHYTRLKKTILRYRHQKRNSVEENTVIKHGLEHEVKVDDKAMERVVKDKGIMLPNGIHSRKFREYCDNCTTPRLCSLTQSLLADLNRFQIRAYAINELKACAHRRFVLGFREVKNYIQIGKVKLLCIATDLEVCAGEAGLDSTITNLKSQCDAGQIPYLFSLRRRQIGHVLYKNVPISCVGILDFDGARNTVTELLNELEKTREDYKKLLQKEACEELMQNDVSVLFEKKCTLV